MINVSSSLSGKAPAIIFICIFLGIIFYLIVAINIEHMENEKIKKAKEMILKGHEDALNGSKSDGIYKEIRKPKICKNQVGQEYIEKVGENVEEENRCREQIKENAKKDIKILSGHLH
jgi:hypothetical protein